MILRIVAVSDTHEHHWHLNIPDGDVFIHAGDITARGDIDALPDFNDFLGSLPHKHKLVIAGNHDFCLEREPERARAMLTNCTYLLDEGVTIAGLNFWGSPWQPWHHNWAFNLHRGGQIRQKWNLIPADTDVLITHGPPLRHGDYTYMGNYVGCADLREIVWKLKPKLHIFGHIHEAAGITRNAHTIFANACTVNLAHKPVNPPLVFDLSL